MVGSVPNAAETEVNGIGGSGRELVGRDLSRGFDALVQRRRRPRRERAQRCVAYWPKGLTFDGRALRAVVLSFAHGSIVNF